MPSMILSIPPKSDTSSHNWRGPAANDPVSVTSDRWFVASAIARPPTSVALLLTEQ
jgi:hypothetical protein